MDVRLPNGTVISNVPDGTTQAQLKSRLGSAGYDLNTLFTPSTAPFDLFTTSEPEKEQAGFLSAFKEQAATLGLADEAAVLAANPTEENRQKLLAAAESKYESAGGFGMDKGLAKNFQAFKELLGGSLGFLAAPVAAATAGSFATPVAGVAAGATTLASQYATQNILRQAQKQEQDIAEGKTPQEISTSKAAVAAVGSTALDYAGMRLFSPLFNKFPALKNLLGEADEVAVKETGRVLEEALRTGKYEVTKGGVLKGAAFGTAFEIPQEIGQQALERWQAGLSLTDADAQEEYKQAAIGAALLGAPMGGAGTAIRTAATKDKALQKLAVEQEELDAEQADVAAAETEEKAAEAAGMAAMKDFARPAPVEDTVAPVKETVVPVEEAVVPEVVAPVKDTDAVETNEIEKMLAEDEQARQQRVADIDTLKAESELETLDLRRQASQQFQTENKRRQVLLPIIESADASYAEAIPEAFSTALKRAGFRDITITPSEQGLIDRAIGALTATPPPKPALEVIPTTPEAAQNQLLEAAATRVRQKQQPGQMSFPGLGKKRITKPAAAEPVSTAPSIVLTDTLLDELQIPKTAPIRKGKNSIVGKDLNTPEVQDALRSYATNEVVQAKNKESSVRVKRALDINRMLRKQVEGVPETQMDLFDRIAPAKKETPAPKAAPVEEVAVPEVAVPVGKTVTPEAVTPEAVTPEAVTPEAVSPEVAAPVEEVEEVVERPTNKIPLRPTTAETKVTSPNRNQVNRVGEIMGVDVQSSRTRLYPGAKVVNVAYSPMEPVDYSVTQTSTGETIHRVTYSDGSVRAVAFNPKGQEIVREFTPGALQAPKPIVAKAVSNTAFPLSTQIVSNIKQNNLSGVLANIAKDKKLSESVRFIARALGSTVGETKIEVVDGLVDASGRPVAGLFNPQTNTIKLDSASGLNTHVLLHEQTHAAVSAVLDNPSHPVTKKLTKLFDQVRPYLDTAYGAENLQEFVAEAFTNTSFQQKLASIINKRESLSAFERFINTVSNFIRGMLGMPHKQQDIRSMDDLNTTIMSIMAPAPKYRNAGELFMVDAKTAATQIDDAIESVPSMSSQQAKNTFQLWFEKGDNALKAVAGQLASLPVLSEIAKRYIPNAGNLANIIRRQEGYRIRIRDAGNSLIKEIQNWAGKDINKLRSFSNLINYSTREEVDASLSEKEAGFKYRNDQVKLDAWDKWSREYEKLGPVGQALYKKVFGQDGKTGYGFLRAQTMETFKIQLKASGATDQQIKSTVAGLEAKLLELGIIEPYAHLSRSGKFWVDYFAVDPVTGKEEYIARAFQSTFERENHIKEVLADKGRLRGDIVRFEQIKNSRYRNAPPGSFVETVLKTLRDNKVSPEVEQEILQSFVNLLPENAYFKGMTERKGTIGFEDAVTALDKSFKRASVQLAANKYKSEINKFESELDVLVETSYREGNPSADKISQYAKAFGPHIEFAMSPSVESWAKVLTSVGFNYSLGANASGYIINMFALPGVVAPYIAGKYVGNYGKVPAGAYIDTSKAVARAMSIWRNSKSFATGLNQMGLEGYDFNDPKLPASMQMFKLLQDEMRDKGQFKQTTVDKELDLEGVSIGPLDKVFGKDWFVKMNRVSGWFMSHSEHLLRETTIMADYQMNLASQLGIQVKELDAAFKAGRITPEIMANAANSAIETADLLNSGVMAQMAPPIGKSGAGKVVLLFRKYSLNLFGLMLHLANSSIRGSAADKQVARAQFAGMFGTTTLIAGVGGAPFFGSLALLYNLFKDDDEDDLETVVRKTVGEGPYSGLGNYLLGAGVSSRVGLSDFLFREAFHSKDQPYMFQALELLGGPVFGMGLQIESGIGRIGEGNVSRGVESMLPIAIRNPLKALRFYTEGPQTMDGDQMMPPIDEKEAIFQILGFAPAAYVQQIEKNSATYRQSKAVTEKRTDIYRRYFRAFQDHDVEELNNIIEEVAEYNQKYPDYPISAQDIIKSIKTRLRGQAMSLDGVSVSPRLRQRFIESRDEWDSVDTLWGDLLGGEE